MSTVVSYEGGSALVGCLWMQVDWFIYHVWRILFVTFIHFIFIWIYRGLYYYFFTFNTVIWVGSLYVYFAQLCSTFYFYCFLSIMTLYCEVAQLHSHYTMVTYNTTNKSECVHSLVHAVDKESYFWHNYEIWIKDMR